MIETHGVLGSDQGAAAGSADEVDRDAPLGQGPDHPDVRNTPRSTPTQHQPDCSPRDEARQEDWRDS